MKIDFEELPHQIESFISRYVHLSECLALPFSVVSVHHPSLSHLIIFGFWLVICFADACFHLASNKPPLKSFFGFVFPNPANSPPVRKQKQNIWSALHSLFFPPRTVTSLTVLFLAAQGKGRRLLTKVCSLAYKHTHTVTLQSVNLLYRLLVVLIWNDLEI